MFRPYLPGKSIAYTGTCPGDAAYEYNGGQVVGSVHADDHKIVNIRTGNASNLTQGTRNGVHGLYPSNN